MVSRGEVALIIAAIGLESNLLSQDIFAVIVVVVLVTTIVTPPMMKLFFKSNTQQQTNTIKFNSLSVCTPHFAGRAKYFN